VVGVKGGRTRWVIAGLLLLTVVALVGCGASGPTRSQYSLGSQTTPPGTYTVQVVASTDTVQHSLPLTLIVQQ
jgi:hypothetical protein